MSQRHARRPSGRPTRLGMRARHPGLPQAVRRGVPTGRASPWQMHRLRHLLLLTIVLAVAVLAVESARHSRAASVAQAGAALVAHAATDAARAESGATTELGTDSGAVSDVHSGATTAGGQWAVVSPVGDDTIAALTPAGPPVNLPAMAGWYRLAADEHGVSDHLLRALHQVESNAAPDGCIANLEDSGAIGPFQFKPATFGQYGIDANHDGDRDICAFSDALFSAAHYLRVLGAANLDDEATREALVRYGTDPDRVLALAIHYRDMAARRP